MNCYCKFHCASLLLLCLLVFGCDNTPKPDGLPDLAPLTITVIQDGAPLADAAVCLFPVSGPWNAVGKTDATGKVSMYTQGRYAGVAIGSYKVTVVKDEIEKAVAASDPDADSKPAGGFSLVEVQYRDAETTTLTLEVAKGQKEATVDVGKAVREKLPELK